MSGHFFESNIARCNRNFFLANLLFSLILVIFIKLFFVRFLYNMVCGPFMLDNTALSSLSEKHYGYNSDIDKNCYILQNKYYFRLDGSHVINSAVISKVNLGRRLGNHFMDGYFLLKKYGRKYLTIKTSSQQQKKYYTGILGDLPPKSAWEVTASPVIKITEDDLLPYYLDTNGSYRDEINQRLFLLVFLIGINLWNYGRILYRISHMKHHPLYKRLSRYGTVNDVIASIDEEVSHENAKIPKEGLATKNWMIRRKLFKVEIERNYKNCKID